MRCAHRLNNNRKRRCRRATSNHQKYCWQHEKTYQVGGVRDVTEEVDIQKFFPNTNKANKLQITDVGLYSITFPDEADLITNLIAKQVPSPSKMIITDATAGLGGNTISFAKVFKRVNSVEKDETHFEMMKNNVEVYGLSNKVKFYNDDVTQVLDDLDHQIVFFDPPWGGRSYKKHDRLRLFLSNRSVVSLVNQLSRDKKVKLIVLKVPFNFDLTDLVKRARYNSIHVLKLYKFNLILIKDSKKLKH